MSTATHAVRIAGPLRGASVAVLGAGTIGLVTLLAARGARPASVAITDPVAGKRELALELGADVAFDPTGRDVAEAIRSALPHRPDVIFDCVSSQSSTDQAISLALKGGTVVVEGVPRGRVSVALEIQDREVRLQGTAMYTREDVLEALRLVEAGAPVERLVSSEFSLAQSADAFAAAASGEEVKVHIAVSASLPLPQWSSP